MTAWFGVLAFVIEHGFYKTDQGRQHYLMNLKQIVDSVNLTAYHGVIRCCPRTTTRVGAPTWCCGHARRMRAQRRRWAVVQKQERGLYILDAEVKDTMKYEGVKPNTWIFPSKMSIYCTMVPSAEVEFTVRCGCICKPREGSREHAHVPWLQGLRDTPI